MGYAGVILQNFILELDGKPVGRISSVSGGAVRADVSEANTGFGHGKQLTLHTPDPISFKCGAGMSRVFYDWLKDTFNLTYTARKGAVVAIDSNNKEIFRLDFLNALIESIALPSLDTSSKDHGVITVGFRPQSIRKGQGGGNANLGSYISPQAKPWNISNFALSISGLEKDCATVTGIGALGIGQKITVDTTGRSKTPELVPANSGYPALNITLPSSSADGFLDWFQKSIDTGKSTGDRSGSLEYRGPDSKTVLFSLDFSAIEVSEQAFSKSDDSFAKPVKVSMFYDSVKFSAHSAAIF